jgi:hypothetical protein
MIKRHTLVAITFCILFGASAATILAADQAAKAPSEQPRLLVREAHYDYGFTPQDVKVSHEFWLINSGGDTLRLTDIKAPWKCTRAPLTKKVLAVGDSTNAELIFSTGKYKYRIKKSAQIMCNSISKAPRLTFTAHPIADYDSLGIVSLNPIAIDLDADNPEYRKKPGEYRIQVTNLSDEPIKLALIDAPSTRDIKISVPGGTIKPGKEKTIKVKIKSGMAEETFTKSFTIEISNKAQTRFTIPIQKNLPWDSEGHSSR